MRTQFLMDTQRFHHFSQEGRALAVDPRSLSLYRVLPQAGWPWARKRYETVSIPAPRIRNLGEERNHLLAKNQLSRAYCFLNISHACNLQCAYCFAGGGAYGGPQEVMSIGLAKDAVEWVLGSCNSKRIVLNLFGGEPFLNVSTLCETIVYAVNRCRQRDQHLSIVLSTNGTMNLLEVGNKLRRVQHWITVSLDGSASLQNLNRPFRDGSASYGTIANNVRTYISQFGPSNISVRATWRRGQSDLVGSVQSLLGLGFCNVNIGRETAFDKDSYQPMNTSDFDEILDAYDALGRWYARALNGQQRVVVQPLNWIMCAILHSRITRYRCTPGINKWCIAPSGKVYPCHRFVGDERFDMGHISSCSVGNDLLLPSSLTGTLLPHHCEGCWVRYWCFSDNCMYLSSIGGDFRLLSGFCTHMRRFIEMVCFHVSSLSEEGRNTLLST